MALFEIGRVFSGHDESQQPYHLGLLKSGKSCDKHWRDTSKAVDMYDIKQDVWHILSFLNVPLNNLTLSRDVPPYYHSGRAGRFALGNQMYGYFGEIHPKILQKYDIHVPVMGAELFLEQIPLPKAKKQTALPLVDIPALLPLTRDFAVVVGRDVLADKILRAVRKADKKYITAVDIFDIYTGEHIAVDKKSVALRVTLQPLDKNFVEQDIENLSQAILRSLVQDVGAVLRS